MQYDVSEFALARMSASELERRLRALGPRLTRVRVSRHVWNELATQATRPPGEPLRLNDLAFRGVPVVCDLPSDHKPGFVFVYEG